MTHPHLATLFATTLLCLLASNNWATELADTEFFEQKIRPLLVEHCQECHGADKQEGGLRLDSRTGWETGGDRGQAIVPGKPDASLLIKMVRGEPGRPPQMPPESVLPEKLIAELVKWVELGAPDPRSGSATVVREIDWDAAQKHWAYQPLRATSLPAIVDPRFSQPIDRFVAQHQRASGLAPVGRASKPVLIRRVTYGLTGLPPSRDEIQAFLADESPSAWEKVIDRLLATKAYGEWQGRHWLDVARYAEDQAQVKEPIPHAWRYRDWVIEAFNDDLPYDKFVKYQLAADLMQAEGVDYEQLPALGFLGLGTSYPRPNDLARLQADEWDDRVDTLTRGFLGLTVSCARCHDHKYDPIPTQDYYSLTGVIACTTKSTLLPVAPPETIAAHAAAKAIANEKRELAAEYLQAQSDRVALTKLASLTNYALAVWKYHAEKSQKTPDLKHEDFAKTLDLDGASLRKLDDYLRRDRGKDYPLAAWKSLLPQADGPAEPSAEVIALTKLLAELAQQNLSEPLKKRNLDQQKDLFGEQGVFPLTEAVLLASADESWKAEYAKLTGVAKAAADQVPPEPAQCQGVQDQPTDKIKDLKVYLRGDPAKPGPPAPRRFLRILAGTDAPEFTQGSGRRELAESIASAENPLTARVIVNRIWQQHFGRGIVRNTSNFGTLGTPPTHPELLDYLAQQFIAQGWSLKRLHREILLSESYQLASTSPATHVAKDPENQGLWHMPRRRLTVEEFRDSILAVCGVLDRTAGGPSTDIDEPGNVRRTVYGKVSRYQLSAVLRLFDFPDPNLTSDRRNETTLPQQMLFLMNSPFMVQRSQELAARLAKTTEPAQQVQQAFALVYGREASPAEIDLGSKFLSAADPEDAGQNKLARLERLAQSLLLSNEFTFID